MNMMRNANNPYAFRGYRSHPVYLERVNNFMANIKGDDDTKNDEETEMEATEDEEFEAQSYPHQQQSYQPQQQQSSYKSIVALQQEQFNNPYNNSNYNQANMTSALHTLHHLSKAANGKKSLQQAQQQQPSAYEAPAPVAAPSKVPAKVKSSDLRNKRTRITSNQAQSTPQPQSNSHSMFINGQRRQASYSVKLALGSGAYQADSL